MNKDTSTVGDKGSDMDSHCYLGKKKGRTIGKDLGCNMKPRIS